MAETANQPIKQFKAGALSVSVWKREAADSVFYNATPQRCFTRDDGKTFEYTDSFGRDDLPIVAALLNQAFSFIVAQQSK